MRRATLTTKNVTLPPVPVMAPPLIVAGVQPVTDGHSYESEVQELIRQRAYEKWEAAGRPEGQDVHFWCEAEGEVLLGHGPCADS